MKGKLFGKSALPIILTLVMIMTGGLVFAATRSGTVDYQSMAWKDLYASEENLTWVFTGDSITHVADYTAGMNGYPEYVEQRLIEMGREGDTVINSAWGGITILELKNDTKNYITKYNPDVVFIKIGMNDRIKTTYGSDFANRVELFEKYYQEVIDATIKAGKENGKIPKITLISSTPRSSDTLLNQEQFDEDTCWPFALVAKKLAEENGLGYVDFMTAFAEKAKELGDDYAYMFFSDDSDGATHPNQAAHHFMFETVSKEIGMYDATSPLYQIEPEDLKDYALYPDIEDSTDVALVGGKYYTSLAAAFDAVPTNGEETVVTIVNDAEVKSLITLKNGQNVVLTDDGTAHTLIRSKEYATGKFFDVAGGSKLTIKGSSNSDDNVTMIIDGNSAMSNTSTASQLVHVYAGAEFTLGSGASLQNNNTKWGSAILIYGTFYMNGGYIRNNRADGDNGGAIVIHTTGHMKMTGGTISGNYASSAGGAIQMNANNTNANGALLIEGGTITGNTAGTYGGGIRVQAKTTITGGVIKDNKASTAGAADIRTASVNIAVGGKAQIGELWVAKSQTVEIISDLTEATNGTIVVTWEAGYNAGTQLLTGNTELIANNYKKFALPESITDAAIDSTGKIIAISTGGKEESKNVALIGSTPYTSLKDAFAAVPTDGTVTTITLVNDVTMTKDDNIKLAAGQNVILTDDGSIRTISRDVSNTARIITIVPNSQLTLKGTGSDTNPTLILDGKNVLCGNTSASFIAIGNTSTDYAGAKLVMNSGVALQNNKVQYAPAMVVFGHFEMNGGTIRDNECTGDNGGAMAIHNNGTVTMTGGSITGNKTTGANKNGGAMNITGGTTTRDAFIMTGGSITGNSATGEGGAIMAQAKTVITGGTISGNTAAAAKGIRVSNVDITIGGSAVIDAIWLHTTNPLKINISSPLTAATEGSILVERYNNNYAIGFQLLSGSSVATDYKKFKLPSSVADVAIDANGKLIEASVSGEGLVPSSSIVRAMSTNYVWAIAGAEQMSTVETTNGHRSLARLIENTLRYETANRSVRMINASAPGYTVSYLLENYEDLMGKYNPDVMMLLPEVSEVYSKDYKHSADKVAKYKEDVISLLNQEGIKVKILITPLPSTDPTINGYINDYVKAVREIAQASPALAFVDLNAYVTAHLNNASAVRNWFGTDMNIQPVAAIEFAKQILTDLKGQGLSLASYQNLVQNTFRESTDDRVFDTNYRTDNIAADVALNGLSATVDISPILKVYPELTNIHFALLPAAGCGNYNKNIQTITGISQEGNKYTFLVPAGDTVIVAYGEYNGKIYRFKDLQLEVTPAPGQENIKVTYEEPANPDGVYLDSLAVVGAPAIELVDGYFTYKVNLYQYQRTIQILAEAQRGLTIKVDGTDVVSGKYSQEIDVALGETKSIDVSVSDGKEEKVYKVEVTRPTYPDIYVTEVIANGVNYSDSEEYDVIEIFNASGRDLNLLDYSVGYKIDFTQSTTDFSKTDWPYYFTGNTQAFNGVACYTGVNQITKYSATMGKAEPGEVNFPANSTMVIWVKYTAVDNVASDNRTFQSLINAVNANSLSITSDDGESMKVLPTEDQIVVAELPVGQTVAAPTSGRAITTYESNVHYFYLRNSRTNEASIAAAGAFNRNWLFILNAGAVADSKGQITEAGDDIHTAANFTRLDDNDNGKSVIFTFDVEGGKSVIPNNDVYTKDTKLHTSDEQSYNLYNTLGAIEYMQKPLKLDDTQKAEVTNKTVHETTIDKVSIDLDITDNTDIRYIELYVKIGNGKYAVVRKDLVLETTAKSATGTATDITSYSYSHSVSESEIGSAESVSYYALVYDGNGNVTEIGSKEEPLTITFDSNDQPDVPKTYVAMIGEVGYETLEDAFAAVPANGTETTIKVIADIELETEIAVLPNQKVVLTNDDVTRTIKRADSNVEKAVGEGTTLATANLFKITSGASLTVKGSSASNEESAARLIIDGNREALYARYGTANNTYTQLVFVVAGGTFTMEDGCVLENNASSYGGAVLTQGTFNMNGGIIRNNVSYANVGGAVAVHTAGTMNMKGGTITGNEASASNGGAIMVHGTSVVNMSGGTISGNTAGTYGGAIRLDNTAVMTMTGGTITGNRAGTYGGGIILQTSSVLNLEGGTISENAAAGSFGGGIVAEATSTVNMTEGTISKNTAVTLGAGIVVRANGVLNLKGGTITENKTGTNGGGIYTQDAAVINMSGGTISNNVAGSGSTGQGGGIFIYNKNTAPVALNMTGGTITGNTAYKYGGGIDAFSRIEITGGTITGNSGIGTEGTDGIVLHTVRHGIGGSAVIDAIWLQTNFQIDILSALTAASDKSMLLTINKTDVSNYPEGLRVLIGTADDLAASYKKFALPSTVTDVVLAEDGYLRARVADPGTIEVTGNTTLADLTEGYATGNTITLTVSKTGQDEMTGLQAVVEGAGKDAFTATLDKTTLNGNETATLTITFKEGMAAGTYAATVKVTSNEDTTGQTVTLSQVVNPKDPGTLTVTGNTTLADLVEGYTSGNTITLTISKTGDGDMTGLQALVSGAGKDAYTVSLDKTTLNGNETATLTITFKEGMPVGTYDISVVLTSNEDAVGQTITLSQVVKEEVKENQPGDDKKPEGSDNPTQQNPSDQTPANSDKVSPATGDGFAFGWYLLVFVACAGIVVAVGAYKKRT